MRLWPVVCVAACGRPAVGSYRDAVVAAGPSSYWQLDDPVGSSVIADTIEYAYGSVAGAVTFGTRGAIASRHETCATFDDNQWIEFGNVFGFSAGETFTIELWIRPTAAEVARPFLSKGDYIDHDGGYALFVEGSDPPDVELASFDPATGQNIGVGLPIALDRWTYFVAVVAGTRELVYLDGELAALSDVSARWGASAQPFTLSGPSDDASGVGSFHGSLDEVAIYARALDPDEIKTHYELGSTP